MSSGKRSDGPQGGKRPLAFLASCLSSGVWEQQLPERFSYGIASFQCILCPSSSMCSRQGKNIPQHAEAWQHQHVYNASWPDASNAAGPKCLSVQANSRSLDDVAGHEGQVLHFRAVGCAGEKSHRGEQDMRVTLFCAHKCPKY